MPIGAFDRRALAAVRYARLAPADRRLAVHVADGGACAVTDAWLGAGVPFPLDVVEGGGPVDEAVAALANRLLDDADQVVVPVARMSLPGRFARLLHDRTADAIVRRLEGVPGAVSVVVPVPVPAPAR